MRIRRALLVIFWSTIVTVLAGYVVLNLLLITLVPILHRFTIIVHVEDKSKTTPISGATVTWAGSEEVLGTTDTNGILRIPMLIRSQPLWAIPRIGSHGLNGKTLKIVKSGYRDTVLPISSQAPVISHSQTEVQISAKMASEE